MASKAAASAAASSEPGSGAACFLFCLLVPSPACRFLFLVVMRSFLMWEGREMLWSFL